MNTTPEKLDSPRKPKPEPPEPAFFRPLKRWLVPVLSVALCLFVLAEVNYPQLGPQAELAIFAMFGLVLCFLTFPLLPRLQGNTLARVLDVVWILLTVVTCGYIVVQTESMFEGFWLEGKSLGDRAGLIITTDFYIGLVGLILVIEGTRRSIGIALPILSLVFIAYAYFGPRLPDFLFPHGGMSPYDIVAATFLKDLGIFGIALNVMFKYVFLFVIFGSFLEVTGGTQFIIDFSRRIFGGSPGGPAKVSVLGSGLMGSLSGSAVANAVTTGAFTIPMMRSAGFPPHVAGGITAAAASGGALVPPIMGAGAYMMLEIIEPKVSFVEIMMAAVIPAVLYYLSIFMIVHFYAKLTGSKPEKSDDTQPLLKMLVQYEGFVFFGALLALIGFLTGWFGLMTPSSPSRSVTYTLGVIILLGVVHPHKTLTPGVAYAALVKSAKNGISLVAASACVGIVLGIVQASGVTQDFNSAVAGVVEHSLLAALIGIMVVSILLGMGLPSAVCYLLMATLMGSVLRDLGVIPLAAHLFIFYFGMMSMVTPPVALAAYASASIAQAPIMATSFAAFRFSLVGFLLPFIFVYRPELLLMSNKPQVTVTAAMARESLVDVSMTLNQYGKPQGNAYVEFSPRLADGRSASTTTNSVGFASTRLDAGEYEVWYKNEFDESRYLGRLVVDASSVEPPESSSEGQSASAQAAVFYDRRLAVTDVVIATAAAVIGIVALAAAITGCLFTGMHPGVRIGMFIAALLLLSPDVRIAATQVGMYTNIAGVVLFGATAQINWLRSRRQVTNGL